MDKILSILQKCILFKNYSLDEIDYFLSNINYKICSYNKNEIVFSPNQIADTIGIILSGTTAVEKLFPSGKVVIITKKNSPDLIAEPSIFSKTEYYPATISVYKPCKILFIHKTELIKLFSLDKNIMMNFLTSISDSTLILKQKIEILSLNSIHEKIACFLINEHKKNKSYEIKLPFSKKAWAEHLNVSRTSLSRELKKLEVDGLISFKKQDINIKNLELLQEILYK